MRTVTVRGRVGKPPVRVGEETYRCPQRKRRLMSRRLFDVLRVGLAAGKRGITSDELLEATGTNAPSLAVSELRSRHGYRIDSRHEGRRKMHTVFRYWFYTLRGETA